MAFQFQNGITPTALNATLVTKSDTVDLVQPAIAVYIGGAGNLQITTLNGDTVLLTALAVGVVHWITARRIWSTNTTATLIIALS